MPAPEEVATGPRAGELDRLGLAVRALVAQGSVRVLAAGGLIVATLRVWLGVSGRAGLTMADAAVVGVALVAAPALEWVAHRWLFHAPQRSRRARWLRVGRSHRRHHHDPGALAWIFIPTGGTVALMAVTAVLALGWAVPIAALAGVGAVGPSLTAIAVGWLAIVNYEWTHLLAHAAVGLGSDRSRRLARHHRRHHHRDEGSRFGVTTTVVDRLAGTCP